MADQWTDIVAHPQTGFLRAVSEAGAIAVYHDTTLMWRKTVPTDWLRFVRIAVSPQGQAGVIGQGGDGLAWLVTANSAESKGKTFGQDPVAIRYVNGEFVVYIQTAADTYTVNGVPHKMPWSSQGIRNVRSDGTVVLGQDSVAGKEFSGYGFQRWTESDGFIVGQHGFGIGVLRQSPTPHFFTAYHGTMAEGVHFAVAGSLIAVVALTEHGAFFKVFGPQLPPHEPLVVPAPQPPPVITIPKDEPKIMTLPNHLATLNTVRAKYPEKITPDEAVSMLNEVAWIHRDEGFGLLRKDSGNHGRQPKTNVFCSCDWLVHKPSGLGSDVLVDGPDGNTNPVTLGVAGTTWGGGAPFDTSKFVGPVDPEVAKPVDPPVVPVPPVVPAVPDRSAEMLEVHKECLAELQAIHSELTGIRRDLDNLGNSIKQYGPTFLAALATSQTVDGKTGGFSGLLGGLFGGKK